MTNKERTIRKERNKKKKARKISPFKKIMINNKKRTPDLCKWKELNSGPFIC